MENSNFPLLWDFLLKSGNTALYKERKRFIRNKIEFRGQVNTNHLKLCVKQRRGISQTDGWGLGNDAGVIAKQGLQLVAWAGGRRWKVYS